MLKRATPLIAAALLLTTGLAGCIGTDGSDEIDAQSTSLDDGTIRVTNATQPLAFAQVTLLDGTGTVVATTSANETGQLSIDELPSAAQRLVVTASGHGTWTGAIDDVPVEIQLEPTDGIPDPSDETPALDFLRPIQLGGAYLADRPETCETYNCGASEPVIELDSEGTIYVSGVCCVGESPPIWYSEDDGNSFTLLRGDVLRDNFGIEGDFAIDQAGNLYFSDISVASAYISTWDSDQEHRRTVPVGPFAPIVDRPWIRAGAEDTAFFAYNTGTSTWLYETTDGGLTWTPLKEFPGALGTLERGPGLEDLSVAAGGQIWFSDDGGETWTDPEQIPRPSEDGEKFQPYDVQTIDENGNHWVVYDWSKDDEEAYHVYATMRSPAGEWSEPVQVSPDEGTHHLPWGAAGKTGSLALAWYGTLDDEVGPNSVDGDADWHLYTGVSVDADTTDPSFAVTKPDPKKVHEGPMNRKLLDFLQIEIGPEGAVHVAYAQDRNGQADERTEYVRSTTGLDLAHEVYPNGP
jgi:hypothetical protein